MSHRVADFRTAGCRQLLDLAQAATERWSGDLRARDQFARREADAEEELRDAIVQFLGDARALREHCGLGLGLARLSLGLL